jgi:hypothetical protein
VAHDKRSAGREIVAAAEQLKRGFERLGEQLSGEAATFERHAEEVGRRLAEGAQIAEGEIGTLMRGLGREIDKLAQKARA